MLYRQEMLPDPDVISILFFFSLCAEQYLEVQGNVQSTKWSPSGQKKLIPHIPQKE